MYFADGNSGFSPWPPGPVALGLQWAESIMAGGRGGRKLLTYYTVAGKQRQQETTGVGWETPFQGITPVYPTRLLLRESIQL